MGLIFTVRACGYLLGSVAAGLLTDRYPARSKLWIALSLLATAGGAAAVPLSRRSVLGSWVRRSAPFPPFRIPYRVPHGVTPRS